jgi:hypothetical protein
MGLLTGSEQNYYDSGDFGGYQFTSLTDIIDNFMATYIGEGKILPTTKRSDVTFHAMRAMQELSFDTFKSCKAQEIEVPPNLMMPLPRDYVNYVKLSWSDASGIEHVIYPAIKTSNPKAIQQNTAGDYLLSAEGNLVNGTSTIVLEGEHINITVGMTVKAAGIPIGSKVLSTSTVNNITTITISNNALYTSVETLAFNVRLPKIVHQSNAVLVGFLTTTVGLNKIVYMGQNPGDVSDLVIGMTVSHAAFSVGTIITGINHISGVPYITTSIAATAAFTGTNVNFVEYNGVSDTLSAYNSSQVLSTNTSVYSDDNYWPLDGSRYGLDPSHAQANGSYFIDCSTGKIHFSASLVGKTIILKYISDGLGTDEEMIVHKFAEEAMYKWIIYGCVSGRIDIPEYVVRRLKKERFAETRKAKIRLSNIKIEEITQILRGKSKQIKH